MNRGRIQAQGKGCEESQPWSQLNIPTKHDGREKVYMLKQSLNRTQRQERAMCFCQLERFISRAPSVGYDRCSRSYTPQTPQEDVRVDVEIIKGRAFCDDN